MNHMIELAPPPSAKTAARALEIASVWVVDKKQVVVLTGNLWRDPAAWGLMLADLARHVARAYENQGHDQTAVSARIYEAFMAEWHHPTDEPEQLP